MTSCRPGGRFSHAGVKFEVQQIEAGHDKAGVASFLCAKKPGHARRILFLAVFSVDRGSQKG